MADEASSPAPITNDTHDIIALPTGHTIAVPKEVPDDVKASIASAAHNSLSPEPELSATALSGKPDPSIGALVATQPVMPRLAKGRDYLDNPTSLEGLNKLYSDAGPSLFMKPAGTPQFGEKLVPIDQSGKFGTTTTAGDGRDPKGVMSLKTTIPGSSQAIIHTHPFGQSPLPSDQDYETATKIGKPNFVMSRDALYVAMPGGDTSHPVKVADISPGKHGQISINWSK